MKSLARLLARSFIFNRARQLHDQTSTDWSHPLSKWQKVMVGSYMILRDYAEGVFPLRQETEEDAFLAEAAYQDQLIDVWKTKEELDLFEMQKPFWHGSQNGHLPDFYTIQSHFHKCAVNPPMRLLEVGCGSGWMAEFFAASGFGVLATSLDPSAENMIGRRRDSLIAKGLPHELQFRQSAMEYIENATADLDAFDALYVYEALHHAHDWKKSICAFYEILRPGGWCFILNEPNVIHTFVSYRLAKLTNTHEIGMNLEELKKQLKLAGFKTVKVLKNKAHCFVKPIWIAAQK